jgi:L-lactate dehydrogenase complex protein LldE
MVDQFFPRVGWSMVKVLEHLDCEVRYNPNQTCCGMPAYINGLRESAKEVATKFMEDFNTRTPIVSPSASCVDMVRNHYDNFFKNTSYHNIYRGLQQRIFEFSQYLVHELKVTQLPARLEGRVALLCNCHAQNGLDIKDEPLKLLGMVQGLELVHPGNFGHCCGYSGDFAVHHEEEAVAMANKMLDAYEQAGAKIVVSNEYQCLFHFQGITRKQERPLQFMHLAEVLAQGW